MCTPNISYYECDMPKIYEVCHSRKVQKGVTVPKYKSQEKNSQITVKTVFSNPRKHRITVTLERKWIFLPQNGWKNEAEVDRGVCREADSNTEVSGEISKHCLCGNNLLYSLGFWSG